MRPLRLLKANTKKRWAEILHVFPNEREKEKNSKFFHQRLTVCDSRWSVPVNRPMYGDIPLMLCKISFYQRDMVERWQMEMYKRQAFKTIDNKVVLGKNNNKSALASNWPQIPWSSKKTKSPIKFKIIHELVDLNIHNYLQFSKETRMRNSHAYKFQLPFSSKNAPNSPFSRGPLGSGISSQQRSCCLHRSLCSRRKRLHFWTTIQTSLVNNMYFYLFIYFTS